MKRRNKYKYIEVVKDYPGRRLDLLAQEANYPAPGVKWTSEMQADAERLTKLSFMRLLREGVIVKRYDIHGFEIYFPADDIKANDFPKTRDELSEIRIALVVDAERRKRNLTGKSPSPK